MDRARGTISRQRNKADATAKAPPRLLSRPPAIVADSELPGTILSIQILRFIAALSVVVYHAHLLLARSLPGHSYDKLDHAFGVGKSGVHIFFVISGFVMVYTSTRSRLTPGGFLTRRFVRIFPIYWLMMGAYLLSHQLLGTPYHLKIWKIAAGGILTPGYSSLVIGPGWTLSYEMYFYICFALAIFSGVRTGLVLLSGFYVASVVVGLWLEPSTPWSRLATNSLLLEFLAGGWLGMAFLRGWTVARGVGAALTVGGACLFLVGVWLPYERFPSVLSWGIPALMLVSGSLGFEPLLQGNLGRRAAKLGDCSYLLYLSLVLVLDLLIATPISMLNVSETSAVLLTAPLSVACVIIAAIGYRTIERPMLNAIKRILLSRSKHSLAPSLVSS